MNFIITNREILQEGTNQEQIRPDGRERASDNLRFGEYTKGEFILYPEPNRDEDLIYSGVKGKDEGSLKGSVRFFKKLYETLKNSSEEKDDVLFFIHGFNTDLPGLEENIKELTDKYVNSPDSPIGHLVLFTWPGRSPLLPLHYRDDKKDAILSGEALGRAFHKMVSFMSKFLGQDQNEECGRNIHLMLHSMGHRVFKHTLMEIDNLKLPRVQVFDKILCIAGDVDYDIFEWGLAFDNLIDFGSEVHIYYHKKDRVLDISKYTKNLTNRLGKHGRKNSSRPQDDVFEHDMTHVKDHPSYGLRDEALNHWYYYTAPEAVSHIISSLNRNTQ